MSKKKKKLYKKKNNTVKNLTENILKVFNQNSSQSFNYKQVASKLKIEDANGKQQIIEKITALKEQGKLEETDRGKFKIIQNESYYTGKVDVTARGNGYVICEELCFAQ